ncbi:MAG: hydroxyacid dehydrogenase [Mycobacteriales bacterium]
MSTPRVLLALSPRLVPDLLPGPVLAQLTAVADCDPRLVVTDWEAAAAELANAEVLLTGWGCPWIGAEVLAAAPALRAVVHAAGSVKHHLDPVVFSRGIAVSSAAEANARPVAEYAVAAIVLARKRVFARAREYAAGTAPPDYVPAEDAGSYRATVGIVGASRIGRLTCRLLAGYDVDLLVADPYLDPAGAAALGASLVDLDTLCATADVVSLHAPDLPETRHLLDTGRLALLRDGAVLVNTARGSLVDTEALVGHCAAGRIDAVLDVTEPEPLPAGHPLLHLPNVLVSPHLAGARGNELRRLGEFAVAEITRLARGEPLAGEIRGDDLARIA